MKILVYGAGVIGSYLCRLLMENGVDVTLLARGAWKENLEKNGLVIYHRLQKKKTVDYPRIVDVLDENERFDAVFAVMQFTQIRQILPDLARANTPLVLLIGNNARAEETEAELKRRCPEGREKTVLFGFSATGGRRENGKVQCVRFGGLHITCGKLHSEPDEETKAALSKIFGKKNEPKYMTDMNGWLLCHLAFILPICYVSYACGCDLRKAGKQRISSVMTACGECFALFRRLDVPIIPDGGEKSCEPGFSRGFTELLLRIMSKTKIGDLACTDHCRHAVSEMEALDAALEALRTKAPDVKMPVWDKLRNAMPDWNRLHKVYDSQRS